MGESVTNSRNFAPQITVALKCLPYVVCNEELGSSQKIYLSRNIIPFLRNEHRNKVAKSKTNTNTYTLLMCIDVSIESILVFESRYTENNILQNNILQAYIKYYILL
jgi:hypothetical protein